jgi:hypothetical protein
MRISEHSQVTRLFAERHVRRIELNTNFTAVWLKRASAVGRLLPCVDFGERLLGHP